VAVFAVAQFSRIPVRVGPEGPGGLGRVGRGDLRFLPGALLWVPIVAAIGAVLGHDTGSPAPPHLADRVAYPYQLTARREPLPASRVLAVAGGSFLIDSSPMLNPGRDTDRPDTRLAAVLAAFVVRSRHQRFDRDVGGGRIAVRRGWPRPVSAWPPPSG